MSVERHTVGHAPGRTDELRAEIRQTREQLGQTVEALAYRTDVKARTGDRVQEVKQNATARVIELRETASTKADQATTKLNEVTPDAAKTAAAEATQQVRANPAPVAIGAALAVGLLLGRRLARG